MKLLSNGSPSTLGSYKKLAAEFLGDEAVTFIQAKIDESPNGENEIVVMSEEQMIRLLYSIGGKKLS